MAFSFLRSAFAVFALGLAGLGAAAHAQPTQIEVDADKDWGHDWTNMSFPAQLGDFQRTRVSQFEERQTNIGVNYEDRSTRTILTLYIYRPGNPSTAIWFDRALVAIGVDEDGETNQSYGAVDLDDLKIGSFTPPGGTVESGQFAVLEVDGPFRSTGVALYRAGEWLIKVRVSSRQLTVSEMSGMLKSTIAQLPALENVDPNPAQYVERCPTNLNPDPAIPVEVDAGMTIMMGVMPSPFLPSESGDRERAENVQVAKYCREDARRNQYNIYRLNQSEDSYTVAMGDAGASIEIYPDQMLAVLLEQSEDRPETIYVVESSNGLNRLIHTPFATLPTLQNVAASALDGPVIVSVNRPLSEDEGNSVRISSDAIIQE